jgi:hypothetical protein
VAEASADEADPTTAEPLDAALLWARATERKGRAARAYFILNYLRSNMNEVWDKEEEWGRKEGHQSRPVLIHPRSIVHPNLSTNAISAAHSLPLGLRHAVNKF